MWQCQHNELGCCVIKYGVRGAEADLDGLVQGKVSEPLGFDEGLY